MGRKKLNVETAVITIRVPLDVKNRLSKRGEMAQEVFRVMNEHKRIIISSLDEIRTKFTPTEWKCLYWVYSVRELEINADNIKEIIKNEVAINSVFEKNGVNVSYFIRRIDGMTFTQCCALCERLREFENADVKTEKMLETWANF